MCAVWCMCMCVCVCSSAAAVGFSRVGLDLQGVLNGQTRSVFDQQLAHSVSVSVHREATATFLFREGSFVLV